LCVAFHACVGVVVKGLPDGEEAVDVAEVQVSVPL